MFTTSPRLHIRRPSPTTAEFTVTTLPPPTLPFRALRAVLLTFRIALALTTALALHSRWVQCPIARPLDAYASAPPSLLSEDTIWHALFRIHRSTPGLALSRLLESVPTPILLPAAALLLYILALRVHASESLLVMRGLGVQTSGRPRLYPLLLPGGDGANTRFIPTEKIRDILVNEAFCGFEVRYYLVVVVEGEDDVVVVFPGLLPRRHIVETVWRGARECLWEGGGGSKGRGVEDKAGG